jgi:hypothetical protein
MPVDTRQEESMKNSEAIAGIVAALCGIVLAIWFAYTVMAPAMSRPQPKSDQQLCEERGCVYVRLRSGPNRCFAKEAFK